MMLDRMEGNAELKTSVQQMLATRRLTHSVLLVGEAGLGTGFAARCIAADYLYPAGGAAAEALLRGECCRAVAKAGKRDSGTVETGIVREAISVSGMGSGGKYLVGQVTAMRSEIFNTSLSAEVSPGRSMHITAAGRFAIDIETGMVLRHGYGSFLVLDADPGGSMGRTEMRGVSRQSLQ